jgi:hypothetical protein
MLRSDIRLVDEAGVEAEAGVEEEGSSCMAVALVALEGTGETDLSAVESSPSSNFLRFLGCECSEDDDADCFFSV